MNCQRVQDSLLDRLDETLSSADATAFDLHLQTCEACRLDYASLARTVGALDGLPPEEPGPRLRAQFLAMLDDEVRRETVAKRAPGLRTSGRGLIADLFGVRPAFQVGFAFAMLALGAFLGARFFAPKPPAAGDATTHRELADLRSKVDSMSQLVAYALARQQPDNARLRAVADDLQQGHLDSKKLNQLVGALAFDPSVNVRLSALQALYAHADQPIAREGVLAALPRERSPLVQLAMIDFLAAVHDHKAGPALRSLAQDSTADKNVRAAAGVALARISPFPYRS